MTDPSENRSPDHDSFSASEKRRIRLARQSIYLIPIAAGLLTICVGIAADFANWRNDQFLLLLALIANAGLAGVASAYVVAQLHAVERGKWWRAGTSFLFACVMTLAATIFWGMLAGCTGLI